MVWFWGNKKENADPPGMGSGPDFVGDQKSAALDPDTPYVRAAPTYAAPPLNPVAQGELSKGKFFIVPPDAPPQQYSRYTDNYEMKVANPQEHLETGNIGGYSGAPLENHHGFSGELEGMWEPPGRDLPVRNPHNYSFTRPWHLTPNLDENHFSLADHPTDFPSVPFGMTPAGLRRNTYRVEPAPWDQHIYDTTPETAGLASTQIQADYVVPDPLPSRGRGGSWRLM